MQCCSRRRWFEWRCRGEGWCWCGCSLCFDRSRFLWRRLTGGKRWFTVKWWWTVVVGGVKGPMDVWRRFDGGRWVEKRMTSRGVCMAEVDGELYGDRS
ncbi:hypothetical protein Hanom_Chr11g00989831 [Helianthus anomalus]